MKKRVDWKILVLCLVIVYAIAFIGSLFTSQNVNSSWYESIKPGITPPNYVFPIVWNILFFLIAISLYFAWTSSKNKTQRKTVAWIFGINFFLNLLRFLHIFSSFFSNRISVEPQLNILRI